MEANVLIRVAVNSGNNLRIAQWIAEEIRDYAMGVVGVTEARIDRVEEASTDGEA